ncbi:MAG TPA: alpha-ketoglutarate-dependent dioxygenase AlkB [Steroidobacteraceae bacterium]|nr:alpha-ketoglutarate-dependent dioxygenase AlkB [Steroidobacteraceae bacterium]
MAQGVLFPTTGEVFATGFAYEPGFLSSEEEALLIGEIGKLPLAPAEYKQYLARRRIVSYGGRYDYTARRLGQGEPIAPFLLPLRARAAAWIGCAAESLTHALVAEYAPGVPLGWHRDVPDFEFVIGISLLSDCRMRFRPYPPRPREKSIALELAARSIYSLRGDARWNWQHSVPPVPALRYSITFRSQNGQRLLAHAGKSPCA